MIFFDIVFFVKQKTAYEMRISDWSSDVCSSDLAYAEFRTLNPSIAEINAAFAWAGLPEGTFTGNYTGAPYDPANVFAIVRGSNTNAASDFLQGVDLSARYRLDAWGGSLSLHFSGTWLTEAHRTLSSTSPEIPTAGIAFFPQEFTDIGRAPR